MNRSQVTQYIQGVIHRHAGQNNSRDLMSDIKKELLAGRLISVFATRDMTKPAKCPGPIYIYGVCYLDDYGEKLFAAVVGIDNDDAVSWD